MRERGPKVRPARTWVRVLGGFELSVGRQQIALPTQAQRVIGYLAVLHRASRRDRLAGTLWPFSSQARALANLRTAIWRINQAGDRVVVTDRNLVRLNDHVEVDADIAILTARELVGGNAPLDLPTATLRLLEADLLPGWDEAWLLVERERLHQLRMHALEALSRQLVKSGRYSEAIEAAISAVAAEPLRESAHTALIEVHIAEGNISEASREIGRYERLLISELGIQPSTRFRAMLENSDLGN